ncbi:MAG: GntR family transcriptional regulator [Clostridiaceae bacterium]|jgi:GntR family transcriptional regulator|nr:GntR family transcriptional regulator [Clostridiaceae bacterium]
MINIDARSSKPIFEQVVYKIKENIIMGGLSPGDKMPSIRELSKMLTINPNTVSKAYAELERQKLIETISGKGTYVSLDYKPKVDEDRFRKLRDVLKDAIVEAHCMGIGQKQLAEIINGIYKDIER